ncbi:creatininase family protein [Sinisalibacter aestuarii]|uniref:Creatininase n=1 Tax=Sinisalibacter aestuarii TaxID=2949426 RepID=A0ABQ5LY89_9RHOB|nr:creatininase family protein [Sinisalibacter aestuarii]GKY89926.1 creatininase [Sinisalibacter aestuarii]
MQWADLKADEISGLPKDETIVVVPVASLEHHGPHLPTGVDIVLTSEIARRTAVLTDPHRPVLVTPAVWSGLAEMHMSLGGTITLDLDTLHAVLRSICRSIVRQGFGKVLLLNGHGGNIAALGAITNEIGSTLDIAIATTSYWEHAAERFAAILEDQDTIGHACEGETSMMLALAEGLVDRDKFGQAIGPDNPTVADIAGPAVLRWRSFAARSTVTGTLGNPTRASAGKGERLLDAAAESLSAFLRNDAFWNMSY